MLSSSAMKYRKLGTAGPEVSEIGFGSWAIGGSWGDQKESDSIEALETALDKGVSFIDTAAGYGNGRSERIIGEFLKSRPEKVSVCTKTRAWNDRPAALETLQKMKAEGLIKQVGISTPEHDQNCVIQLMREGMIDVAQVIYNIFEQEPAAQILPIAGETGTGIIVRVAFDEGVLTGKYKGTETFGPDDFRHNYYAGGKLSYPGYP